MPLSFADVVPVALFPAQGFRWRLATRGLSADAWLQFDDTCTTYLAEKCRVLQEHRDDALAVVPGSEVAAVELADLVAEALTAAGRQLPPDRAEQHPIEW
ncbi:MAG: DUF3445 domain-containing protein, partial [Acidimicrobiales bacterium]|nr:DUF3445 domain-containing protein [Acidimicrobiales bacterium]